MLTESRAINFFGLPTTTGLRQPSFPDSQIHNFLFLREALKTITGGGHLRRQPPFHSPQCPIEASKL